MRGIRDFTCFGGFPPCKLIVAPPRPSVSTNGMVRRLYLVRSLCMRGLRRRRPMELHTIGIDLGKTVFHLVGLNLHGEVVVRKKFSRTQLLRFTANAHVELIGMEACGGAHFPSSRPPGSWPDQSIQ